VDVDSIPYVHQEEISFVPTCEGYTSSFEAFTCIIRVVNDNKLCHYCRYISYENTMNATEIVQSLLKILHPDLV